MAKTATTLFLGLTIGLLGVLVYNRLRDEADHDDAEFLLRKIGNHLVELDAARQMESALPS